MAELANKKGGNNNAGIIQSTRNYIDRMLKEVSEMKIMLLDTETTGILSMVYTQTQILSKQVYLVEHVKNTSLHGRMMHLKAVAFVRPTMANIELLKKELADPHFSQYHIYFSNFVPQDFLSQLAKADVHEVVATVQEFYADFYAVNFDAFTLNLPSSLSLALPKDMWGSGQERNFDRAAQGVLALLLSLKLKPQVRYQNSIDLARQFARKVQQNILSESALFTFRNKGKNAPVLLILDRRDDPITPLLTQWTYQAMVHEMIGVNDNRVDMSRAPGIRKDLKQTVLSPADDTFYATNMYKNFGDIGGAVKELLNRYQTELKDNQNLGLVGWIFVNF
jgi:vacuolar protein sorting-associated protein 45